jgi:hypothetical protein
MSDVGNVVSASLPVHRVRALIMEAIGLWWQPTSTASGLGWRDIGTRRSQVLARLVTAFPWEQDDCFKISARFGSELVTIEDRSSRGIHDSWLARMSEAEWHTFFDEYSRIAQTKVASGARSMCDVWIGAGGGFQALGALHLIPWGEATQFSRFPMLVR